MTEIYKLKVNVINNVICKRFIGIYYLVNKVNGEFIIKYVGRSDKMLRRRLIQHARKQKYTHFSYKSTRTIKDAFFLECREWHRVEGLDNKMHPDSPNNLPYKCPYCHVINQFNIKEI